MATFRLLSICALFGVASICQADTLLVPHPVPYSADSRVAQKIKDECKIGEQLADYLKEYAAQKGTTVQFTDAVDPGMQGRVLAIEIVDAVSAGNAWVGHHKSSTVAGTLYDDGALVASFEGARFSMGGAFAGYKGSCSVLGRTVKALAQDISIWLTAPVDGARLGDLN